MYLPKDAAWLDEYVREITIFPGGRFDDQVDSTSQAFEILGPLASPADYQPFSWGVRSYESC